MTMGRVSYHSIPTIKLTNGLCCAVETTITFDDKVLQLFVGVDDENMSHMITMRYKCYSYKVVDDCAVWEHF